MLGGMGGELETDLPFKLVHPHPGQPDSLIIYTLLVLVLFFNILFTFTQVKDS